MTAQLTARKARTAVAQRIAPSTLQSRRYRRLRHPQRVVPSQRPGTRNRVCIDTDAAATRRYPHQPHRSCLKVPRSATDRRRNTARSEYIVDQSQSFVGLSPLSNPHDLYRAGDRQRNQRKLLTNTAGLEYDHSISMRRSPLRATAQRHADHATGGGRPLRRRRQRCRIGTLVYGACCIARCMDPETASAPPAFVQVGHCFRSG